MSKTLPLSPHFTWAEAQATDSLIPNVIPPELEDNVRIAAEMAEVIRAELGGPVIITSWYRSPAVNAAVGGSKTSAHMKGLAFDFRPTTVSIKVAFQRILATYLPFDQLILESTNGIVEHIHVGFADPRREVMLANRVGGKTTYSYYNG